MELDPESISYLVNVILLPILGVLIIKVRKYAPALAMYASQVATLRRQTRTVLNVLGSVRAIASTVDKSLADGRLDPEEAEQIIVQIKELVDSPEVQVLMGELA